MPTSRRIAVPMTARDAGEDHRVSTPLELLFDLTFVVAVSQVSREFAHSVAAQHAIGALPSFLMVFFAIWWAWMNFSWFATAYDTDDVPYRLLTLVQMSGVLVLAANVPAAFEEKNFTGIVVGYLIMRVAMIAQWTRAAVSDPERRSVGLRYAGLIAVVQVFWVLRVFVPEGLAVISFVVLAIAEMAVPLIAERPISTTWHPHHIAERYGLFTIIVLGECVTASSVAVQGTVGEGGWNLDVVLVFVGGLITMFALWWIYYLKPAGEGLERRPDLSFVWGYGHFGIFASLAALGAGLEVTAEALGHHTETSDTAVAFAVAVPVSVFLLLVWGLHAPLAAGSRFSDLPTVAAAVATTLVVAALTGAGLALPVALLLIGLPAAAIVTSAVLTGRATAS
jgi:low temperature requirement protein LtrA